MKKLRILYLEDNPTDFEMVKANLEDEGILDEMIRVETKEEFVQALTTHYFDVVLTDYALPLFHGLEAIQIAKEKSPDTPVIMITGKLPDEVAVDLIKKGAWDYILKENIFRLISSLNSVMEKVKFRQERKKALNTLREKEENYRILAESSPYGIIVHSEGKVIYANNQALKIFHIDPEDRSNHYLKDLFDYIHPESMDTVKERVKYLYQGMNLDSISELKFQDNNGRTIFVEVASTSITFNGKPAAQVIFRDIAERKRMEMELVRAKEKAEEADRLKTAFLENLSHEIRTPLNGIMGFASLLKFDDLSKEEKENYIKIIEESGVHLLSIIDDLIQISSINANQVDIKNEEFNLNVLLEDIYIFFNDSTKYKKFPVLLNLAKEKSDEDALIYSDKSRIRQVFFNLISNAYKFTEEGRIDFGYREIENGIQFFTRDTGIGIPFESRELVFERFRQLDENANRLYGGTGLGLAISKGLVEAMDGKIWFESRVGQGTEFIFDLPVSFISPKKAKVDNDQPAKDNNWSGRSVLIAEDEQSNYILLQHLLSKTGIKITHVSTGTEALDMLSGNKYDMALLDIKIPEKDGIEVAREIRKTNPDIPLIAQTAYVMSDDRQRCLDAGFNEFIAKPIKAAELFGKMSVYFNNK